MRKARWHGFYTDAHGREEIIVDAHGNQVTTVLRGVTFTGNALNDLAPVTALPPPCAIRSVLRGIVRLHD
jgi:hypothetical protein